MLARSGARRPGAAAARSGRGPGRHPRGAAPSPSRRARSRRSCEPRRRAVPARSSSGAGGRRRAPPTPCPGRGRHEGRVRLVRPPADAPAELVELREPEPVGRLDDHDARPGDVDADLERRSCRRARPAPRRATAPSPHRAPAAFIRPWTSPTRNGASSSRQPLLPPPPRRRCPSPPISSIAGTTTNVARPAAASARTNCQSRSRSSGWRMSGLDRASAPPAASGGSRHRGPRRGPGRASAGSASRSSAGRAGSFPPALASSCPRCSTPNRCCSSMTTRPRAREGYGLLEERVRPHDDRRHPGRDHLDAPDAARRRSASPPAARRGGPRARGATSACRWCCRASRSVGARRAAWRPARAAAARA